MLLRFLKIYAIALLLSVVLDACKCSEEGEYQKISTISFKAYNTYSSDFEAILVKRDTLFMRLQFTTDCIAKTQSAPISDFFISRAMAFSKQCICGKKGYVNPVTQVKIFADSAYAGRPAGSDITSLVGVFKNYQSSTTILPVDSISQSIMEDYTAYNGNGYKHFGLFLTQKPGDSLLHTFTIKVTSPDSVRTSTTFPVRWY